MDFIQVSIYTNKIPACPFIDRALAPHGLYAMVISLDVKSLSKACNGAAP